MQLMNYRHFHEIQSVLKWSLLYAMTLHSIRIIMNEFFRCTMIVSRKFNEWIIPKNKTQLFMHKYACIYFTKNNNNIFYRLYFVAFLIWIWIARLNCFYSNSYSYLLSILDLHTCTHCGLEYAFTVLSYR